MIRALQRGGMAVEGSAQGWEVYRERDRRRRPVGTLDRVAVDALRSSGHLCPLGEAGDRLVWTGPMPEPVPEAVRPDPPGEPSSILKRRRSPMEQVLGALPDEHNKVRARNAALRLNGDIHRAASPQAVTMRWDAAGAVDGTRRAGAGGASLAALAAGRRLAAVRAAMGEQGCNAVVALVLHERPVGRIAAEAGWPKGRGAAVLAERLLDLADAYDRCTR